MKNTLYEKIYQDIVEKIQSGYYTPGQKLPTEYEMTELYHVSRITATRAMKELEKNLFVFRKQKAGTFVRDYFNVTLSDTENELLPVVLPFDRNIGLGMIFGAQSTASLNGIFTSFFHTQNNVRTERAVLEKLLTLNIVGLVICTCSTHENLDLLSRFILRKIPVVLLDQGVLGLNAPRVSSDNRMGTYKIVEALIQNGHTRIAYYPYYANMSQTEQQRFRGYCEAFLDQGLVINNDYLFVLPTSLFSRLGLSPQHRQNEISERYVDLAIDYYETLRSMPTAVVCANDITAYCFIRRLNARGYRVPEDVSVTGFDNLEFPDLDVGITSIQQDNYNLGSLAVEKIMAIRAGRPIEQETLLSVQYVEKTSTRVLVKQKTAEKQRPHEAEEISVSASQNRTIAE